MELTFNFVDFVSRVKSIIRTPNKALSKIEKEKGLNKAVSFYVALSLVGVVIGILFVYVITPLLKPLFPNGTFVDIEPLSVQGLINLLIIYLVDIALSFVMAAVLYIWIRLFRGNEGYQKAYQLYVYTQTPSYLTRSFPYLSIIGWVYSLYLLIIGTAKIYKIKKVVAFLMYVVPLAVLFFLASNYMPVV